MDATLRMLWRGPDGSEWDLLDERSPVRIVRAAGMGMPEFTNRRTVAPNRDGERYRGTKWGVNTLSLTVTVGDIFPALGFLDRRYGDDWRRLDASWRAAVSPEATGEFVVISDAAGERRLRCRLDDKVTIPDTMNPADLGEATYTLPLVADDQPWWVGADVTDEFGWSDAGVPFFGKPGDDHLFAFSPSSPTDTASIGNPGDRDGYLRWKARGPFGAVGVTVGDREVRLPFAVGGNQLVHVDTERQSIVDDHGNSLWPLMGFANPRFGALPSKTAAPIGIRFTDPGEGARVFLALTPRYAGPW